MKNWRNFGLAFGVTLFVLLGMGAPSTQADGGVVHVRMMNASPGSPPADVYLDGNLFFRNVSFPIISAYEQPAAGNHTIRILPAGSDPKTPAVIPDVTTVFEQNKDYTLIVFGKMPALEVVRLEDNKMPTEQNKARVRFIHASPDAPGLDLCVVGQANCFGSNLGYKGTAIASLTGGPYSIDLRQSGTPNILGNISINLECGAVYTLVAIGVINGEPRFGIIPVKDATPGPTTPCNIPLGITPTPVNKLCPPNSVPECGALLSPEALALLGGVGLFVLAIGFMVVRWQFKKL